MGSADTGLATMKAITTTTLSMGDEMAAGKRGPNVHVVPAKNHPGKFVAKVEKKSQTLGKPTTQAGAIRKGTPVAKANHSELIIHRRDGTIRDSDSFGGDPHPPKDKKH